MFSQVIYIYIHTYNNNNNDIPKIYLSRSGCNLFFEFSIGPFEVSVFILIASRHNLRKGVYTDV